MLHLQRCAHAFKNRADETQEVENNCFILEIRVLDSKCHEEHCETQPDSKKSTFSWNIYKLWQNRG